MGSSSTHSAASSCGDDRRCAERSTNTGDAAVCFDADQGRITLNLGPKIGAVVLFLRNGCRHWDREHVDDFHGRFFPGQLTLSRFGLPLRSIAECQTPRINAGGLSLM